MEKIILDKETIEKLEEFEKKVLKHRIRYYAKNGELILDDFYAMLDEAIDVYTELEEENDKLKTEIFYNTSREDDYE